MWAGNGVAKLANIVSAWMYGPFQVTLIVSGSSALTSSTNCASSSGASIEIPKREPNPGGRSRAPTIFACRALVSRFSAMRRKSESESASPNSGTSGKAYLRSELVQFSSILKSGTRAWKRQKTYQSECQENERYQVFTHKSNYLAPLV